MAEETRGGGNSGTLSVRCYAFGVGQSWEALCVDLDIAVSGTSLNEVKSSLETSIELYLEEAAEAAPDHRRYLLSRRSPWSVQTKLAFLTWVSALRAGVRGVWRFTLQPRAPTLH